MYRFIHYFISHFISFHKITCQSSAASAVQDQAASSAKYIPRHLLPASA